MKAISFSRFEVGKTRPEQLGVLKTDFNSKITKHARKNTSFTQFKVQRKADLLQTNYNWRDANMQELFYTSKVNSNLLLTDCKDARKENSFARSKVELSKSCNN